MADSRSFKIENVVNLLRAVRSFGNSDELKALSNLKKEFEAFFDDCFVQKLVAKYESMHKDGFDHERAIQLTLEALENRLRTALEGSNQ